jgi:hypothetical protein
MVRVVESSAAEQAAKEAQKREKANQRLKDAQRKRSDAMRRYHDQLSKRLQAGKWWAWQGLNLRPLRCQHSALPLSYTPTGRRM